MQQQFKMEDGTKRVLDKLVARRKLKKQYEYEVQWKGFDPTQNTWMPRDKCAPILPLQILTKHHLIPSCHHPVRMLAISEEAPIAVLYKIDFASLA